MKKVFIFLFLFLIPINVLATSSVTVIDTDNNRILYSSNQHEPKLIASITNIMTT